jgi:A/G-specific adenine glycosylase
VTLAAPSAGRVRRIRRALLPWYAEHGADVPWRPAEGRPGDPYAALVAAVCAQQTPMARVLPLYARWMAALPALGDAARASRAEALRLWGDAGYPRRAVAIRETARIVVREHGGELPREEAALLALPGVGPFTAAIVRCFGHGEQVAAVDVNVVRVLGRAVLGELEPVASLPAARAEALAERMLPPGEAERWNPALMDLGAMICRARPRCEACPLARLCAARPRIARGERAAAPRRQPAYAGSDRQWRGRILRALREHAAGAEGGDETPSLAVRSLVARLAVTPAERARARRLLDVLAAEGLAWRAGGRCGLGEALGIRESARGQRATLERPRAHKREQQG